MSGSIDIGFGGSGGGASAGGGATFSTIKLGPGPWNGSGDVQGSPTFSIYSGTQRLVYTNNTGNVYLGDGATAGFGFLTYGSNMSLYPANLQLNTALVMAGSFSAVTQTVQTASPAAGGGGALPATPKGYWQINLNGANQLLPYY